MNWRMFSIALFNLVMIAGCAALVFQEEVTEDDAKTIAEQKESDPLRELKYAPAERATNLTRFGFSEKEVKEIVKQIETTEDRYEVRTKPDNNRVVNLFEQSDDQDGLTRAICGTNNTLPVRYAAMQYLVQVKASERQPIDLQGVSALAPQDWFTSSRLAQMYEMADLSKERKTDAPRMIIAAVLSQKEEDFVNERSPYGGGFFGGWSWEDATRMTPGLNKRVYSYVAVMHLVFEVASMEEGFCGS